MKLIYTFFCVLILFGGKAQSIDSLALTGFSDAVLELQNSELIRNGTLSVSVKSVNDKKTIFAINSEKSLPSASILKLVSTATILSVLGGDFRYQTFLEYDGFIMKDTLVGNIYIRGTGDPSLGSERFKEYPSGSQLITRWTSAIQKTGIKYIKGDVLADATYFDKNTLADSWIWGDLGNYYGAGVSGLNFNDNQYRIKFKSGINEDDPASFLGIEPAIPYLTFKNLVTTGERGSGDKTVVYGNPLSNQVILTGTVPRGVPTFSVKGSIPDPATYAAYALKQSLATTILVIPETMTFRLIKSAIMPGPRKILDEYKSPPLREICQQANFWSVNLYADSFLKKAGKTLEGKTDYDDAAKAVTNYWWNRKADMRGFFIKDGSGLSPSGSVTTNNLTDILSLATKEASYPDFYKSIAILGVNGTVRNLGKGTKAAGNIRAKSGSIEGTRAYAGYVTTKSGAVLSFAMIANKYQQENSRTVSEELVRLMTLLAGF
ncbi:D-alanyl-D-alanine carboxypeptidase/D-alanyl-D-alanine endopeptidase [Dyadobacter frigoris]|uniref:D-alanyl-D-alanine carboxypeptidase/D-alanyl-D-alanine-endopeptidase n=1 Tax=Dyadobacter frigoris TaxID=2576211 RepID=A0A4U6CXW5_9BACT|nr:D-alanyl-D-alanine carboxypeptidase/D-alanyl-D-alanine-endopeptidase [Dyadobacter frigoris]TKT88587.1 D-alanyl-D-alanine carboxypeptidase/D-alanyl-D-alanine-endopeptidase [Dyadobacter frigoris]GLU54639.1 peptidase S13 [Dyadobacter frigoris]